MTELSKIPNIKTFSCDVNNPKKIKQLILRLSELRNNLLREVNYDEIKFNTTKYNVNSILPVLEEMLETNTQELYDTKENDQNFYVYFHCNPLVPLNVKRNVKHLLLAIKFPSVQYEPFYVGKGQSNRFLDFNRNDTHRKIRKRILDENKEVVPYVIRDNLTESEALNLESNLMDILGLLCFNKNGLLTNLDEGVDYNQRRKLYSNPKAASVLRSNGFIV